MSEEKAKYVQYKPEYSNAAVVPIDEVAEYLKVASPGEKITINVLSLTDEEFEKLPDFQGF